MFLSRVLWITNFLTGQSEFDSQLEQRFFFYTSKLFGGSIQPPIQRQMGIPSSLQKRSWFEASQSSSSSAEAKSVHYFAFYKIGVHYKLHTLSRFYRLTSFHDSSLNTATVCPTSEVRMSTMFLLVIVEN